MAFESEIIWTDKLRKMVKAAGYGLGEFAIACGFSEESMRKYTSKKKATANVKPENLRSMANKLGVALDDLRVVPGGEPARGLDFVIKFAEQHEIAPSLLLSAGKLLKNAANQHESARAKSQKHTTNPSPAPDRP